FPLSLTAHREPRPHQPDSAPGSRAGVLPPVDPVDDDGRDPALRRHIYRALLHHELRVGQPAVLPVRLRGAGVRHPRDHLLGGHHPPVLLPPVRRGLQLVVEELLHQRREHVIRLPL
ncbi:MAG: hypothetical protein BJ554DRAFT_5946, partial [Olpidium bornovanus]